MTTYHQLLSVILIKIKSEMSILKKNVFFLYADPILMIKANKAAFGFGELAYFYNPNRMNRSNTFFFEEFTVLKSYDSAAIGLGDYLHNIVLQIKLLQKHNFFYLDQQFINLHKTKKRSLIKDR